MKKIPIDNEALYTHALTHSSAALDPVLGSNERLEFFGDAVLGVVISEFLYDNYPDWNQGLLTKAKSYLVQDTTLQEAGLNLGLDEELVIGPGEEMSGGRRRASLVADAFEAVIGAVFLDKGLDVARKFILDSLKTALDRLATGNMSLIDYKSRLQEWTQARWKDTPRYVVVDEEGAPHLPHFTIEVQVNNEVMGQGKGGSKKEAEQAAAEVALEALFERYGEG